MGHAVGLLPGAGPEPVPCAPAKRRRRMVLGLALALALELHAVLFVLPARSIQRTRLLPGEGAQAMRMRLLPAERTASASFGLAESEAPATSKDAAQKPAPLPFTASHFPLVDAGPLPVLALPVGGDSDDDYFPRSALSIGPIPEQPVVIDYPADAPADGLRRVTELSLFIDETGRVVRVRVDGPPLPPAFEASARAAFLNARFSPGQIRDHAVRVHLRVEVGFDSGDSVAPGG